MAKKIQQTPDLQASDFQRYGRPGRGDSGAQATVVPERGSNPLGWTLEQYLAYFQSYFNNLYPPNGDPHTANAPSNHPLTP